MRYDLTHTDYSVSMVDSVVVESDATFSKLAAGGYAIQAFSEYCSSEVSRVSLAIYNSLKLNVTRVQHACFGNFTAGIYVIL